MEMDPRRSGLQAQYDLNAVDSGLVSQQMPKKLDLAKANVCIWHLLKAGVILIAGTSKLFAITFKKCFAQSVRAFPLQIDALKVSMAAASQKWTFPGSVSTLLILRDRKKRSTAAGRNGLSPGSQHLLMHDVQPDAAKASW